MLATLLLALQTTDPTLPRDAVPARTAYAEGVQVYRCAQADDHSYGWLFLMPEATLYRPGTHDSIGTHGAGPSWLLFDGVTLTGKLLERSPAPNPGDLPWLLLATTGTPGIAYVRRFDTKGGVAPRTPCDAANRDLIVRVPYQASYTFFNAQPVH